MPEPAPSPFFKGSTLQFAWDNTSLSALQKCPYFYKLTILEGWRSKSSSFHLVFGAHYAKAQERFFKFLASGMDREEALDEVVRLALCETGEYVNGEWLAWDSKDTKKSRETLIRSIVWYFEEYADDSCSTVVLSNGNAAVELSFVLESGLAAPNGEAYLLTGHLDRLVEFGGDKFVMDQKTTGSALGSYYFSRFDLDTQMSQYTFAGRIGFDTPVAGVIIDGAQVMVGFTAFSRGITMRSAGQLEEWLANTGEWFTLAERFADTGVYPQNRQSCENYRGCVFKNICKQDPSVREHFLKTDFEQRFWNPLEVR